MFSFAREETSCPVGLGDGAVSWAEVRRNSDAGSLIFRNFSFLAGEVTTGSAQGLLLSWLCTQRSLLEGLWGTIWGCKGQIQVAMCKAAVAPDF